MKSLYKVVNKNGGTLCFQVAETVSQAIDIARMYGHRTATFAEYYKDAA